MPLPYTLPFNLGEVESISQITDHVAAALRRLIEQYRGKPRFEGLIEVLANRYQTLEDIFWALLTERDVDTAVGAQLDLLGRILKQPRFALVDDTYRLFLKARIKINRSSGTTPELIEIFDLVSSATVEVEEHFPAGLLLRLTGGITTAAEADLFVDMLHSARAAAVYAQLVWAESAPEDVFAFDGTDAQALDVGHLSGATEA